MDHNRRGLALMLSALLLSLLVASLRGGNDKVARTESELDKANRKLIAKSYQVTSPLHDYQIRQIENGVMTVEAGPSLGPGQLKTLASQLTQALHDTDHEELHSDLVMVDIERQGKIVCSASTSARGIWVKLR